MELKKQQKNYFNSKMKIFHRDKNSVFILLPLPQDSHLIIADKSHYLLKPTKHSIHTRTHNNLK
jgi:hypothetical protein